MNKFNRLVTIRILLIFSLSFVGFYTILNTRYWMVALWLFLFAIIGIVELLRFISKTKRELANFLIGIRQKDFSATFKSIAHSQDDAELHNAYTIITEEFKSLRKQKESNYHFLQTVVEHSGVALVGFKISNEEVTLVNRAAKELFDKPFIAGFTTFKQIDRNLATTIRKLKSGEKELIKVLVNNHLLNLSIIAKELVLDEEAYKLISFQNIKAELDEKELEAWQKLIRILTHEIKNSAIPISTLTEVINDMIIDDEGKVKDLSQLDDDELEDIRVGMQTVEKRSKGLVKFVNSYGQLAKIPEPKLEEIKVVELLEGIKNLMRMELERSKVALTIEADDRLTIKADPELIEQVIINLVKNGKEALENSESARITLQAYKDGSDVVVLVSDNGIGIDNEIMENIFVPFYTTKKEGSGIGLSLSRQIMRAHGGSIAVSSIPGEGTTFFLRF